MKSRLQILTIVTFLSPVISTQAAVTVYNNETSFRAAVSSLTLLEEDFNSFTSDTSLDTAVAFLGFSATSSSSNNTATLSRVDVSPFQTATQHPVDNTPYIYASINPSGPSREVLFEFAPNTTAFGADMADANNIGNGSRFILSTGDVVNLPATGLTEAFWGFTSDTPFTSARLVTNSGDGIGIDNTIVAVPEPSATLLGGLASLFLLRRKR